MLWELDWDQDSSFNDKPGASRELNAYLHRVGLDRTVWVGLVEDLRLRGFIDRLSGADIRASSAERLIGLVKTIMTGEDTWPGEEERAPTRSLAKLPAWLLRRTMSWISRSSLLHGSGGKAMLQIIERVAIHPVVSNVWRFPRWYNPTILLHGGKYVLFRGLESVHCWAVDADAWLWSHQTSIPGSSAESFGAEVVNDGKNATVVVCFRKRSLRLSLKLIPDYMILAELARGSQLTAQVTTCAVTALSSHWRRFEDDPAIIFKQVVEISGLAFHIPRHWCPKWAHLQMDIHESPLQSGLYRLWVYTLWSDCDPMVRHSYHVERGTLAFRRKSVTRTPNGHLWYSGHQISPLSLKGAFGQLLARVFKFLWMELRSPQIQTCGKKKRQLLDNTGLCNLQEESVLPTPLLIQNPIFVPTFPGICMPDEFRARRVCRTAEFASTE
ncbi:hypothetical protein C8R44DRAFT_942169 [Mycena epipterygia]|nr:hypothetical protein C8R44DRAFT_942169 [Mycena epipterygia]